MTTAPKPTIIVLTEYYLPGEKGGGPIRSISNMITQLSDYWSFVVVCRDRDLGDSAPYPGIALGQPVRRGPALVYYTRSWLECLRICRKLTAENSNHVLYLNSFFSRPYSIIPMMAIRCGYLRADRITLAPRGEFFPGALRTRQTRKQAFLALASALNLYRQVRWHASTDLEAEAIRLTWTRVHAEKNVASTRNQIIVSAPDPASAYPTGRGHDAAVKHLAPVERGHLTLCFLSRITPSKNLDYALRVIARSDKKIIFNVYGPIQDHDYWQRCLKIIEKMPKNVVVAYHGVVKHEHVHETLARSDALLLPTLGENFGHVIAEALSAGVPVLISDQTPWRDLDGSGVGWDIPLQFDERYLFAIDTLANLSAEQFHALRRRCQAYFAQYVAASFDIEPYRRLFESHDAQHAQVCK